MSEELEQAVLQSALKVFETSAFMSVMPWEESDDLPAADTTAMMSFTGHFDGRICLKVAESALEMLAENMLGESIGDDEGESRRHDALKEVLNMICGNLLTEWAGKEPVFDLSPPEIVSENMNCGVESSESATHILFNLEDTCAEVIVERRS